MILDKCDAYRAKETLGYKGKKFYIQQHQKQKGTVKKQIYRQIIRGRDEPTKVEQKIKKRTVTPIDKKQKKQNQRESR